MSEEQMSDQWGRFGAARGENTSYGHIKVEDETSCVTVFSVKSYFQGNCVILSGFGRTECCL